MIANWTQRWPTGSAYIGSDRAPQDLDYVEFVPESRKEQHESALLDDGWEVCGTGYTRQNEDKWCAYRKGKWNVILCWCPLVYLRWVAFTELARRCCFTSKCDRIELCRAVLEGSVEAAMNIVHRQPFYDTAEYTMQEFLNEH